MTTRIGIYLGTHNDDTENIEKILISWNNYLSSQYELDAFGSAELPDATKSIYNYVGVSEMEFTTPFSKLMAVYRQCQQYINQYSPDCLIQLWKFNTHATGVVTAGYLHGIPTVARYSGDTFNDYKSHNGLHKLGSFILNNVINQYVGIQLADHVIVLGPNGQEAVRRAGVSTNQITIIPPSPDVTGRFHPVEDNTQFRDLLGLPKDRQIALYVGRISKAKGMHFMRKVVAHFEQKDSPLFVLIGEGECKLELDKRFDDSILRTVGHVPYQKIDKYYKSADLYIHPSPLEGIPLVILEALKCGVPVIARRAGDIPFVTPNVVDTAGQMVSMISHKNWEEGWKNKQYFELPYQKTQLRTVIRKSLGKP